MVTVRAAGGAAGGFGRSNKKKADTSAGMVMPEKALKNTSLEELRDDAGPKSKSKAAAAEAGAPAGFPKGNSCGELARGLQLWQPAESIVAVDPVVTAAMRWCAG